MVPEGWRQIPLADLVTFKSGGTPSTQNPDYWSGEIPWISAKDLTSFRLSDSQLKVTMLGAQSGTRLVPEGTVLILVRGMTLHKDVPVGLTTRPMTFNQDVRALLPKNGVQPEFLAYSLVACKQRLRGFVDTAGHGTGRLASDFLQELPILLPPTREQLSITRCLTAWDRAITQTEKLIEAKRKLKKGLMQQLLTGKRRFPEFGAARQRTQGHFYNYPSEWAHPQIKEIASEVAVRNSSGTIQTVLSCSKYAGLVNSLEYFGKQVYSDDISNYKIVQRGQFAYPANHIEEGSIGLLNHVDSGIVSPIYVVFKIDPHKVFAPYLYLLFKTETYRHIFAMATNASVDRRGSLRWKEFSSICVPLPSLDEQRSIAVLLDVADREIKILLRQLEEYKNQKRGLMQKLLTGQIRVKATAEMTA